MIISLSTGLYYKKTFTEALDIVKQSGFENIELMINQTSINLSNEVIKDEIDKRGLTVHSIHATIRLFAPQSPLTEEDYINHCIELARVLGAEYIVTHDIFEKDAQGNVYCDDKKHFGAMAKFKNSPITIMTENMPLGVSPGSIMHDIDYMYQFIKDNDYKITFDVGHAATCEYDIIEAYKLLKPYIRNIHLSDCKNGIEHRVLGQGNLPIKEFLQYIKNDGYEYLLTVEYDFDNKQRNDIQSDKQAIDALVKTRDYLEEALI